MTGLNVVLLGFGIGGAYVLLGQSIVVVFRGSRVLNFSSAATGMFGAYVFFNLWQQHGWPFTGALLTGLISAGAVGATMYVLIMRRIGAASGTARVVATLAFMTVLIGVCGQLFAPGGEAIAVPSLLPVGFLHLSHGLVVPEGQVVLGAVAAAVTGLLIVLQRRTRFGLATVAVAENPVVLASMGSSPDTVATITWAAGAVVAAGAVILLSGFSGLDNSTVPLLVVPALAAALIGRFDSFGLTLLGGMGMGIFESVIVRYVQAPGWEEAGPLLAIVVVLIIRGRSLPGKAHKSERFGSVGPGRTGTFSAIALLAAITLTMVVGTDWLPAVTATVLFAFVVMSVVIVTGFAGQLSLAQLTVAGIAALFVALFAVDLHVPLLAAMAIAVVLTLPVGLVMAIPAVRTRGYELAIITLVIAIVASDLVLVNAPGGNVGQITIFGLDLNAFTDPRGFAIAAIVVFAILAFVAGNLRRGAAGRRFLAVKTNERAAASLGISVPRTKLAAVGFATLVAAVGGVFIEAQFPFTNFSVFTVSNSINTVLYAVIGGTGWISGAPVGALLAPGGIATRVLGLWISPSNWLELGTGLVVLLLLRQSADGVMGLLTRQLKALLCLVRRRHADIQAPQVERVLGASGGQRQSYRAAEMTLSVRDLTVRFGSVEALKDVSLDVRTGELVGLIGPNGAGKTTLVEAVCGFEQQTAGTIVLNDIDIGALSAARRAQLGLGRTFQSIELFDDTTVLDNIRAGASTVGVARYFKDVFWPREPPLSPGAEAAIDEFHLGDHLGELPESLDYWLRRAVGIARALAIGPGILILDEPAAGSDFESREELKRLLQRVARSWNVGMLVIEHDVDFIFALCDRVVALDRGCVIAEGTPIEVRSDAAVISSYLGTSRAANSASKEGL